MSIVGVFLSRTNRKVRIGITGAGQHAFRPTALEEALNKDFSRAAVLSVTIPPDDLLTDIHADAAYRAHLITELTGRAVARCLGQDE
jgi:carbon-monoxide dehydrogenase medium subunit